MTENEYYMIIRRAVSNWFANNQEQYDLNACDEALSLLTDMYFFYVSNKEKE